MAICYRVPLHFFPARCYDQRFAPLSRAIEWMGPCPDPSSLDLKCSSCVTLLPQFDAVVYRVKSQAAARARE